MPDRPDDARTAPHEGLARLLWGEPVLPARGPRPSLDLARIAAETITVADADGLHAVSMQKVADRLGVSKMALYRYVGSKDELVAVAVEQAVGVPPEVGADDDWRAATAAWGAELRETWLAHPWLPAATIGNRVMGPREIAWSEAAAAALASSGLTGDALRAVITLLFSHTRSTLSRELTGTQYWTTADDVGAEMRVLLRESGSAFPRIRAAEAAGVAGFDTWRFGLDVILDGVAARVPDARG
ncbi:TetR/AcrR family transcriptional regulator [Cellulomonas sp. NS3]|uniref:TetR/AcrR family transcriptional regulator n=1 Tax=Cellulomonas sp. NS3 TaxID=2973977 RepID=UPI0021628331|nr:TetR/AcrR family transcriptional regulator [Cellulomonas sp. NS3]